MPSSRPSIRNTLLSSHSLTSQPTAPQTATPETMSPKAPQASASPLRPVLSDGSGGIGAKTTGTFARRLRGVPAAEGADDLPTGPRESARDDAQPEPPLVERLGG